MQAHMNPRDVECLAQWTARPPLWKCWQTHRRQKPACVSHVVLLIERWIMYHLIWCSMIKWCKHCLVEEQPCTLAELNRIVRNPGQLNDGMAGS